MRKINFISHQYKRSGNKERTSFIFRPVLLNLKYQLVLKYNKCLYNINILLQFLINNE